MIGPRVKDEMLEPAAVIGNVVAGRDRFTWDITGVAPGDYAITARLDDGADIDGLDGSDDFIVVELGSINISPLARFLAPPTSATSTPPRSPRDSAISRR